MKKLNQLVTVIFLSLILSGFTWEIIGECSKEPEKKGKIQDIDLSKSLGEISLFIFEQNRIPFIGNVRGFHSILNTPVGDEAIEIISDVEMKAYGWCYLVNGQSSDRLTSDIFFDSREDHLTWYYGYAHYKNGQWISYCTPAYKTSSCDTSK